MAFAIDIGDEDDPYFRLAEKMGWIISNSGNPGITILDVAPWGEYNLVLDLLNPEGPQTLIALHYSPACPTLDWKVHPLR